MKVGGMARAATVALAILGPTSAAAQVDPAQRPEWGAMHGRIQAVTGPYRERLGLAPYWATYCHLQVNAEMDRHPKDGSVPFDVNWNTLGREEFTTALSVREDYETAALVRCLADAKAAMRAAEAPSAPR